MNANNRKNLTIGIVIALACYVLGGLIGLPNVNPTLLNGDINKSKKFTKSVADDVKAYQERLMHDKEFFDQTLASMALLNTRTSEFNTLVETACDIAKNVDELKNAVAALQDVKETANNANNSTQNALMALGKLQEGNPDEQTNLEQLTQNALVNYMLVEKEVKAGKKFVEAVDSFLQGKELEQYVELAMARDIWTSYCTTNAALSKDDEEVAYWNAKETLLKSNNLQATLNENMNKLHYVRNMEGFIGQEVLHDTDKGNIKFDAYTAAMDGDVLNLFKNVATNGMDDVLRSLASGMEGNTLSGKPWKK